MSDDIVDVGYAAMYETDLLPSSCHCWSFGLVRDLDKSYLIVACLINDMMD